MEKQPKKKKRLTVRQIEIAANTDDATIAEMLAENADPNYKFPYSDEFVEKNNLRKPANTGSIVMSGIYKLRIRPA